VQRGLYLALSAGTAAVVAARWGQASAPGRRAMLPSVAGAVCLLLWAALLGVDLVVGGARHPVLLWTAACSIALVPWRSSSACSLAAGPGGLADLFGELVTMQPADLQAALARVLHDPQFAIAYAGPDGGFVDVHGAPVALPDPASGRSVSRVARDGVPWPRSCTTGRSTTTRSWSRPSAGRRRSRWRTGACTRSPTPGSRSCGRPPAPRRAADAERRRIERNLHDGAQQRLVTLALQLSLIQRRIRDDPGDASSSSPARATSSPCRSPSCASSRGDPPRRARAGAGAALEALVLRSPVPAELVAEPGPRLPGHRVRRVLRGVGGAGERRQVRGAPRGVVRLNRDASGAVVEIADDGVGGAEPAAGSGLRGLADRVEAVGGRLLIMSPPGGGTVVTAELPTA
jgi:hypothetical protein